MEYSRLCTFKFDNGTKIRVAVPLPDECRYTFDDYLAKAKAIGFDRGGESGRGPLLSFKVGPQIRTP